MHEEKTLAQIASEYGIHTNVIARWRDQALAALPGAFNDQTAAMQATALAVWEKEREELYAEIGKLSTQLACALALPWFTYGLDVVLLVGRLHLNEHQTVDEVHQNLLTRLAPLGVKIARREILYLFEAYHTLVRASSAAKDDEERLALVKKRRTYLRCVMC